MKQLLNEAAYWLLVLLAMLWALHFTCFFVGMGLDGGYG